MELIDILMI